MFFINDNLDNLDNFFNFRLGTPQTAVCRRRQEMLFSVVQVVVKKMI